jgi:hypothetical protein
VLRGVLDPYERKARLAPAMLAALPVAMSLAAGLWGPDRAALGAFAAMTVEFGVPLALANHTRRRGKAVEWTLWASWGGSPTTRAIRHRGDENPHRRELVRAKLAALAPEVALPSPEDELADPDDADRRYEAATEVARNWIRNTPAGRLVFAENCSYGYHRNLFGLRPLGRAMAWAALGLAITMLAATAFDLIEASVLLVGGAIVIDLGAIVLWTSHVGPAPVEEAAKSYAAAFLGAVAALDVCKQQR